MRTDDIRFLVRDECDGLARAQGLRVMRQHVKPRITERTDATTTIEATCYLIDPDGIPDDRLETVLASDFAPDYETVLLPLNS